MTFLEKMVETAESLEAAAARLRNGEFHRKIDRLLDGDPEAKIDFQSMYALAYVKNSHVVSLELKFFECSGEISDGIYYRVFQIPY